MPSFGNRKARTDPCRQSEAPTVLSRDLARESKPHPPTASIFILHALSLDRVTLTPQIFPEAFHDTAAEFRFRELACWGATPSSISFYRLRQLAPTTPVSRATYSSAETDPPTAKHLTIWSASPQPPALSASFRNQIRPCGPLPCTG
jgi:hypothetical protein